MLLRVCRTRTFFAPTLGCHPNMIELLSRPVAPTETPRWWTWRAGARVRLASTTFPEVSPTPSSSAGIHVSCCRTTSSATCEDRPVGGCPSIPAKPSTPTAQPQTEFRVRFLHIYFVFQLKYTKREILVVRFCLILAQLSYRVVTPFGQG